MTRLARLWAYALAVATLITKLEEVATQLRNLRDLWRGDPPEVPEPPEEGDDRDKAR